MNLSRRTIFWAASALIAVGVGGVALHSYRLRFERGPYAESLYYSSQMVTTALPVTVGTPVLLGGSPVEDKAHVLWHLVGVTPTNLPSGLRLERAAAMHTGRGLFLMVPLSWFQAHPHYHSSLAAVPTRPGTVAEEPVVMVQPTRPGRYVVEGLLVTYQWGAQRYTTYVRQPFVVCAYRTKQEAQTGGCSAAINPPPTVWP